MDTAPTLPMTAPLTADEVARYHRDGYLMVPLVDAAEADALARALDDCVPQGGLRAHTCTPAFAAVARHQRQAAIVAQLLGAEPWIVQSMHRNKEPGGTGIALHQDAHYLRHEPQTLMASWLALSDTDAGNGGLCVVPGSHRGGLRAVSANRDGAEHAVWEIDYEMSDRDGRRWRERIAAMAIDDLDPASVLRLTVPKGSAVFFTGLTIHGSYANHSPDRPRHAFATHFATAGTWLFRTDVQQLVPARRAG